MRSKVEHIARLALGGKIEAGRAASEYAPAAKLFGAFDRILALTTHILKDFGEPVIPNPYVISIPGCGTRFTKAAVNAHGACHLNATAAEFHLEHEPIIVVPLRHPKSVQQSWSLRHRYYPAPYTFDWFWLELHKCLLQYPKIILLPVDHPKYRDECLAAIGRLVGTTYETGWEKKGSEDQKHRHGIDVPADMELIMAYPYVRQFYDAEPP